VATLWFLITCTAEKHEQEQIGAMLEDLMQWVDSNCKRAVDVGAYLQKSDILFIELTKAGQSTDVLRSHTLSS